ncbi:MAG TPA: MarR family winged helix-turn-helix transcriptional regulator [Bauldia sp.]|nr:MarR family winged helix-turn-helix transcriptional regulator [Bauldia sp.]
MRDVGKRDGSPARAAIRKLQERQVSGFREHAELLYLMHELSRLVSTEVDKSMAEHRLTHAQWWALMHLLEHEGVTQSELAAIMQMGRASAGKLMERLEAKHWIERRGDATDSRVRRIYLRNEVVPVFAVMAAEGKRLFRAFLKDVSHAEETRLIAGLRKIKGNAERRGGGI